MTPGEFEGLSTEGRARICFQEPDRILQMHIYRHHRELWPVLASNENLDEDVFEQLAQQCVAERSVSDRAVNSTTAVLSARWPGDMTRIFESVLWEEHSSNGWVDLT